jgi:site-specific DNA recombinase
MRLADATQAPANSNLARQFGTPSRKLATGNPTVQPRSLSIRRKPMELNQPIVRPKRCAIYTRKSAEPPMAQEITSLQSQRSICSAYVSSQQHRGWIELEKGYDDSGRSGSSLNRPALQDLMSDIEVGLVEIVLVYKLDRITRTLLDFVRLIDFFERYGVVFVSITQNFDTSDSMGRLIRNVLLTFAQFEREMASDRIRDKKMVMKQRGFWTGGDAPLGYDLRRGKLIINRLEEPAVRCIFDTYIATQRISAVHRRLLEDGTRRKVWRSKSGGLRGGGRISLSSLHHILKNRVYVCELTHNGAIYPGVHEPILDRSIWERAQQILKEREQFKLRQPSHILTGFLFDAYGRRMHARNFNNPSGCHRYYASALVDWAVRQKLRPMRVQADQLERLVLASLKTLLFDRALIRRLLLGMGIVGTFLDELCERGSAAAVRIDGLSVRQLSAAIKVLIHRTEVSSDCVRLIIWLEALAKFIAWDGVGIFGLNDLDIMRSTKMHVVDIPVAVDRVRRKSWLPLEPRQATPTSPSRSLLDLLEYARAAQALVFKNRDIPIADLAYSLGRKPASFSRLVRLNYLAPDIVTTIIDGAQPTTLTRRRLLECDLPIDWALQRHILRFPAKHELARIGRPLSDLAGPKRALSDGRNPHCSQSIESRADADHSSAAAE